MSTTTTTTKSELPADDAQAESWELTTLEVLGLLKGVQRGDKSQEKFVLVDVRRNDHEGGTIRGSINLPAQSLHLSIPTMYDLFNDAGVLSVIWYCGSCRGRGPRSAGIFRDYLASRGDSIMKSLVLQGGIKGWVVAGDEYLEFVDDYDATKWEPKQD